MLTAVLTALHLHDKLAQPVDGGSFTRRPNWARPLESLWGIFSKWQFVNCVPYSTIASFMLIRPAADAATGVDLRTLEGFDLDAMSNHGGMARAALANGACCRSADSLVLAITSVHLRFCPACLHEGFHATLFQFTLIVRCPIHRSRLHDSCLQCRAPVPYRLDAAFAARPFSCPTCTGSFLPEPTVLAQPHREDPRHEHLQNWQRFLGHYTYWYANGKVPRRDNVGRFAHATDRVNRNVEVHRRLAFVGVLQQRLLVPPPLPQLALMAVVDTTSPPSPPSTPSPHRYRTKRTAPPFSRLLWPHFHTTRFLGLYRRYAQFHSRLDQSEFAAHREVTLWWRRSWEGAVARPCTATHASDLPPFGIAEWLGFAAAPTSHNFSQSPSAALNLRFEHDLWKTWQAWARVLRHVDADSQAEPHPRLVPPRACWLGEPAFEPESTALGF